MAKRSYTPEQRTQALELYRTDGPTRASETTGIPKATVASWAAKAGLRTESLENASVHLKARVQRWEERRLDLANESGSVAELALRKARQNLVDGRDRDAQAAATTYAILVDKAQLLTGAATSRHETVSNVDAEIERLTRELELSGTA